jgi:hypothetical protein
VNIKRERNRERGNFSGLTTLDMKEILRITISMEKERITGQMEESMLGSGKIIRWMVKEPLNGQMEENI